MNDRLKCYVLTALLFLCVTLRAVEPEGVKRPAILGVSHVTLVVKDLAAARAHYTDLLGFKVMAEVQGDPGSASHVYLRINDYQYYDLVAGGSEDTHVAYQVADAEGMRRYLASKGVEVPTASHIDPLGNPALSVKEAEKRTVEFVQYLTGTLPVKARGTAVSSRQFSRRAFHAAIPVIDFEATRHFYQDILGFSEILKSSYEQAPVWINYRLPEAAVYLELALMDKSSTPLQREQRHHLGLAVPDVQEACESLRERATELGLSIETQPYLGKNLRWHVGVFDPDGHRNELMEPYTMK